MSISPRNFQILSPEQANPFLYGMNQGINMSSKSSDIARQNLENIQSAEKLKYLNPNLEQQLQKLIYENQIKGAQAQYANPMEQSKLAYSQAQTPYIQSQTENTKQKTNLMPLDSMISAQHTMQTGNRFGPAYQALQALNAMAPAAKATWISQNGHEYDQLIRETANQNYAPIITPELLRKYLPEMNGGQGVPENIPTSKSQKQSLYDKFGSPEDMALNNEQIAALYGKEGFSDKASASPVRFGPPTEDQLEQQKKALQMSANKYLTTGATQKQNEGAIQVEEMVNSPEFRDKVSSASQYVGAWGKGKRAADIFSQNNPKSLTDYNSLRDVDMPLLLNRIKTLDGMGATNSQREDLYNLYGNAMSSSFSNPKQFMTHFNNLLGTLDRVGKAVQKSANPIANVNRLEGIEPISQDSQSPVQKVINGTTYLYINGKVYGPDDMATKK